MSDRRRRNIKSISANRDFGDGVKHVARHRLWLPEAKALFDIKNRSLKYFTLPGRLTYDIAFLEQNGIIEWNKRGFPDVRFCDFGMSSYTEAKRRIGSTIGIKERFEKIVLDNAPEFWDGFPYDLYNLDFCGTCLPQCEPPFSNTFAAIKKIIEGHYRKDSFPFSIFLTMKALQRETNPQAKKELKANIESNRNYQEFTELINRTIPNTEDFVKHQFANFIIVSIPKFICHLCNPFCDVNIRNRAKYRRYSKKDGNYYITKFVFRFSKRTSSTLQIMNPNYISNVRSIMSLSDVETISNAHVNPRIKQSLRALKERVATGYI